MAYQHYNRMVNHWESKLKVKDTTLTFGSRDRHKSLTPGAGSVAQFVAQHLFSETNSYPISQKTIASKLPLAKSTIGLALEELVAWGIFTRERAHYEPPYRTGRKCKSDCTQIHFELPYIYRLAVECSSDCERIKEHYTPSEIATRPEKQATPSTEKQATPSTEKQTSGLLKNRQLIERNKEINKEMNNHKPPCLNCSGDYEVLPNSKREIIHSNGCSELLLIQSGRAWQITQSELESSWNSLDNREQQIANYLSLAKGKERVAKRDEKIEIASQEKEIKFRKIINRTLADNGLKNYNPLILEWLEIVFKQSGDLTDSHINRAIKFSKLGWHLKPEGEWLMGRMLNSDHFIEGEGSND